MIVYACHSAFALQPEIGKVIGANDFIPVNKDASNIPEIYKDYVDAIGWTNYNCTVTSIGHGLALSAGHCFDATAEITRNKSCRYAKIRWGYRGGQSSNHQSQCESILVMLKSRTADFAILKISQPPKAMVPVDLDHPAQIGDELTLFSHPNGKPLQWSQYCLLEWPQHPNVPTEKMSYTCDTDGGSSGAVILSTHSAKIVGIHNGGFETINYGTHLQEPVLLNELKALIKE